MSTLGFTFTTYSNFHIKYMHFIKCNCNRIIIFDDPDLDTCALSAVRGDGSSPVWLLVAKLRSSWTHHLIPSCARPDGTRPSTVMPVSPSGSSHEQLRNGGRFRPHGRQEQRRTHVSFVCRKTKEASTTGLVCHLLNVPEFKLESHFLEDTQQNRLKVSENK
jgi:hypothetical protein